MDMNDLGKPVLIRFQIQQSMPLLDISVRGQEGQRKGLSHCNNDISFYDIAFALVGNQPMMMDTPSTVIAFEEINITVEVIFIPIFKASSLGGNGPDECASNLLDGDFPMRRFFDMHTSSVQISDATFENQLYKMIKDQINLLLGYGIHGISADDPVGPSMQLSEDHKDGIAAKSSTKKGNSHLSYLQADLNHQLPDHNDDGLFASTASVVNGNFTFTFVRWMDKNHDLVSALRNIITPHELGSTQNGFGFANTSQNGTNTSLQGGQATQNLYDLLASTESNKNRQSAKDVAMTKKAPKTKTNRMPKTTTTKTKIKKNIKVISLGLTPAHLYEMEKLNYEQHNKQVLESKKNPSQASRKVQSTSNRVSNSKNVLTKAVESKEEGKTSASSMGLRRVFQCYKCGKMFKHRSKMIRHKRIHTGEKPFQCEECLKYFRQRCHLRVHAQIHVRKRLAAREANSSANNEGRNKKRMSSSTKASFRRDNTIKPTYGTGNGNKKMRVESSSRSKPLNDNQSAT
eukprot:jgi/Bigna1/74222/fgenesh1_pg.28_\